MYQQENSKKGELGPFQNAPATEDNRFPLDNLTASYNNTTAWYDRPSGNTTEILSENSELKSILSKSQENNFDSTPLQKHGISFFERRSISDDSIMHRRNNTDAKRDRTTSDISDLVAAMSKANDNFFASGLQNCDRGWDPQLPYPADGHEEKEGWPSPQVPFLGDRNEKRDGWPLFQSSTLDGDVKKDGPVGNIEKCQRQDDIYSQNIKQQLDSFMRMQIKVKQLRDEVNKVTQEVKQEEDDINTSSKVQKNPTEKDVMKLKREIEVLKREVMEADRALEKIKSSPPESEGLMPSASNLSPFQVLAKEELNSAIQPSSRPPYSTSEVSSYTTPPYPSRMSASRFPHPNFTTQQFTPVTSPMPEGFNPQPRNETPPPDYSAVMNPIGIAEINGDQWHCVQCTFKNHADLPECEVCGHKRG